MEELFEKIDTIIEKIPTRNCTDMILTEIRDSVDVSNILRLYQLGIIKKEDLSKQELLTKYMLSLNLPIDDLYE